VNLRTIICWVAYNPKRRRIVNGFRTKKEFSRHYTAGIPIGCVLVKMKGNYVPREPQSSGEKQ
jgi:hypothetical protein